MVLKFILLLLVSILCLQAQGNDTTQLSLQQVVAMAKEKSIAAKQAITTKETRYWEWRTYRSNYQPQLSLSGNLPGYNKTFREVVLPNGTVDFQRVRYNNSSLSLAMSQAITPTGGTVFFTTELQRFDDFDRNTKLYNGVPYAFGFSQPVWKFNPLKWDKRIEPLKYQESRQAYIESMEKVGVKATQYYFELLLAQVSHQIARTNLDNTINILRIANEKFDMGKVSRNEILQLELEQVKAEKALGIANRDMEIATLNLRTFTGLQSTDKILLSTPAQTITAKIDTTVVIREALQNRSDAIAFVRRLTEARRDIAKAKGDNGLNATLTARLGYSRSALTLGKVYESPLNQQLVQLEFDIPIMDWGRSRSRTKTAEATKKFVEYAVEQDRQNFVQEIVTQVTLFEMMKEQLKLTARAESIASEKYQIARERYVLGKLSITDLSIAFQENDQAKRDYVYAQRDYWTSWYQLRYLSLYDFETNQKIQYN